MTRNALIILLAAAAVSFSSHSWACTCAELWEPYTPITATITTPTEASNGRGINAEVIFTCSASDRDKHTKTDCTVEYPWDTVTYTWSAPDGGTFPYGNTGRSVTWKAPSTPGNYRVRVTVDDVDGHSPGSDNDPPKTVEITMQVIRLDEVRLYFYYSGAQTAYPYVGGPPMKTRAVVTATHVSQNDYCGMAFDTGLKSWWKAGSEGPLPEAWGSCATLDIEPPVTSAYTGTPSPWPDNWAALDIDWELIWQCQEDPCPGHDRRYYYNDPVDYLSDSWGEDNRTYNTQGVHRLRATARMHPGTSWEQTNTSLDKEYALRICAKAYCDWIEDEMRRDYIEWCSTYVNVPYEWGGEGYGGFDSNGQCAGGSSLYEGYGIDCSGLVSCGAYRAGYNWSVQAGDCFTWRVGTCALAGDYCSSSVAEEDFGAGDIIVDCGVHVVSCVRMLGGDEFRRIHATGAAGKVVEEDCLTTDWTDKEGYNYVLRRLNAH